MTDPAPIFYEEDESACEKAADFDEYQRLRAVASRRHLQPNDLSDVQRQALREARVPDEFAHLDELMND